MSKIVIEINTDNEEFQDNLWGGVNYTIQHWLSTAPSELVKSNLYDRNGNRIGTVNVLKYDKKDFKDLAGGNILIKYNTAQAGTVTLNSALVLGCTNSEVAVSCLGLVYTIAYKDIVAFTEINN